MRKKPRVSQIGDTIAYRSGYAADPLKGVDEELADLNAVINFKFKHVDHQRRMKTDHQRKKSHKKRK